MKQYLLKYVLVMFAIIANTGLLYADTIEKGAPDTCFEKVFKDSTSEAQLDSLQSIEQAQTQEVALAEKNSQWRKEDWIELLDFLKNYRKEAMLIFVFYALLLAILCYIGSGLSRFAFGDEYYLFLSVYSWRKIVFVLLFIFLSILLDSSWFYLIVAALIIYYLDKKQLCSDLLEGIVRVIRILQGKMDVASLTEKEMQEQYKNESDEYKKLLKDEALTEGKTFKLSETQIEQYAQDTKIIKEIAYAHYEKFYPNMQRNVGLRISARRRLYIDGFVSNESHNIMLKLAYCNSLLSVTMLMMYVLSLLNAAKNLSDDTKKETKISLVIISRDSIIQQAVKRFLVIPKYKNLSVDYYTIDTLVQQKQKNDQLIKTLTNPK